MPRPKRQGEIHTPRTKPPTTMEARENEMIDLAIEVAKRQLIDGNASSQVITHYLKLGTLREQLEKEKLISENELLKARVESMASMQRQEELYAEALKAMKTYSGQRVDFDDED